MNSHDFSVDKKFITFITEEAFIDMEGGVKFIFKTLIKVPIYIYAAFLVFNVFAFCFIYFKMLGFSYLVQQTAVENNYIPAEQLNSFADYLTDFDNSIAMVENCNIIISDKYDETAKTNSMDTLALRRAASGSGVKYTVSTTKSDALRKKQYGADVTVGVTCNYVWVWPLDYRNTTTGNINSSYSMNRNYYDGSIDIEYNYDSDSPDKRKMKGTGDFVTDTRMTNSGIGDNETPNIVIKYTVPGLKYYPDLT